MMFILGKGDSETTDEKGNYDTLDYVTFLATTHTSQRPWYLVLC